MTRQTYERAPRLTKLATAHISKGGIAHRSCHFRWTGSNHSIRNRPVVRRTLIWSLYTREKTGWLDSMTTYHSRRQLRVIPFVISALHREDPNCITIHQWISSGEFPPWNEIKGLHPELPSLCHHRNNLSLDNNGIIWRKRSSQSSRLQLLIPKPGREELFVTYHASLFGGHLGRIRQWLVWHTAFIGQECQTMLKSG